MRLASLLLLLITGLAACAPLEPLREAPGAAQRGERPAPPTYTEADGERALERYSQRRAGTEDERPDVYRPWIAVLPFTDASGFRDGVWELEHEPPAFLTRRMGRSQAWRVTPYEAVRHVAGEPPDHWETAELERIADVLRVDMLITGTVLDYNMERMHVGDPLVGGYKSYKGTAEFEAQLLRAVDGERVGTTHTQQESIDRGLGLDLLGKPREEDHDFLNLDRMTYGGERFQGTAIGQATLQAMDRLVEELEQLVQPQIVQFESARILSVAGDEVFISVGGENGVQRGYRFAVYREADQVEAGAAARVGVVEVVDVIGARVSQVRALTGGQQLREGYLLRLLGRQSDDASGADEDE